MYTREHAARILAKGGWSDAMIEEALGESEFLGVGELDADWRVIYVLDMPHAPFIITCAEITCAEPG